MTNCFCHARRGPARAMQAAAILLAGLAFVFAAPPGGGKAAAQTALVTGATAETRLFGRRLSLRLDLDGPAPFRVFTLVEPPRLVIDVAGALADDFDPAVLAAVGPVAAARPAPVSPDWARLVLTLTRPMRLESAELRGTAGSASLDIRLARTDAARFAAASGPPPGVLAPAPVTEPRAAPILVAVDAGHGGIDPGAVREGLREKDIALAFALDLARAIAAEPGLRVMLTRESDVFLRLDERVARARSAGAAVFVSIHTNAVTDAGAAGAILFTRADRGSDAGAADRARLENAADRLAGLDGTGVDAPVHGALAALARRDTDARSALLARTLADALEAAGPLSPAPLQSADFRVLGAVDTPSVLVEIGFLSNPGDRARMNDPRWRARAALALAQGLARWRVADAALTARMRR